MTRKKEKEQTADVFDESTLDDDTLAEKLGTVRTVTIKHTPTEEGTREEISIEGYPPRAAATMMSDMTSAFVAVLCKHVPEGSAKLALFRSFLPGAISEIDRYHRRNGIEEPALNNMLSKLVEQLTSTGLRDKKGKEDERAEEG